MTLPLPASRPQVDTDHPVPLLVGDVEHVGVAHDAGVVDQGVEPAGQLQRARHDALGGVVLGHVGDDRRRPPADRLDLGGGGGETVSVEVDQHQIAAGVRQAEREGETDPLTSTGDDAAAAAKVEEVAGDVGEREGSAEGHGVAPLEAPPDERPCGRGGFLRSSKVPRERPSADRPRRRGQSPSTGAGRVTTPAATI
jgi:hypothetical protein